MAGLLVRGGLASLAPKRHQIALITGASGVCGRPILVVALLENGASVHGVSRERHSHAEMRWHQVDLVDADAVRSLMSRVAPDVVFHLAGRVTGSRDLSEVSRTFAGNLTSTLNVLLAAASCGCPRVVLAGSMEELGGAGDKLGSGYAVSKLAGTAYARLFHTGVRTGRWSTCASS